MISAEKHPPIEINIKAELLEAQKEGGRPELTAYAFNSQGRYLGRDSLDGEGCAQIKLQSPGKAGTVRVLVGPTLSTGDRADFAELVRRGAQEHHVQLGLQKPALHASFKIPPIIWNCWLRSACIVKGTLLKRSVIGASEIDLPVCDARVEIYEVDPLPLLIPKLPDFVLDRLRDLIAGPARPPVPEPRPGLALSLRAGVSENRLAVAAVPQEPARQPAALPAVAAASSKIELRQALIEHSPLVRQLLWRYFPRFVSMQKVATATTDRCGHFQTLFFQGCFTQDKPDLYFKATQKISATDEITIYEPKPIGANTWWNYASGTEVTLYTTHPQAHTCAACAPVTGPDPQKNLWVAFLAIGNLPLSRIHGTSKALAASTPTGEQAARRGLTDAGQPWGGLLRPRLVFSEALEAAGVKYYRVSWRRAGSGSFQPLQGGIQRYYRHEVSTPGGMRPAWSPMTLGPSTVKRPDGIDEIGLMKIPYSSLLGPGQTWDPPPGDVNLIDHLSSAKFPTHELAPGLSFRSDGTPEPGTTDQSGLYELKVELFTQNGELVNVNALGIQFAVPDVQDLSGIINTVNADDPALGLVQGSSMIITLHVDNNGCFADIDAPSIGPAVPGGAPTVADECCGVLHGANDHIVTLGYKAHHPHGFATYRFMVVRGVMTVVDTASVSVDDPGTPADEDPTDTPVQQRVDSLMTANPAPGCDPGGCTVAGFSENLWVSSKATDGWYQHVAGVATKVRAFVLSR